MEREEKVLKLISDAKSLYDLNRHEIEHYLKDNPNSKLDFVIDMRLGEINSDFDYYEERIEKARASRRQGDIELFNATLKSVETSILRVIEELTELNPRYSGS